MSEPTLTDIARQLDEKLKESMRTKDQPMLNLVRMLKTKMMERRTAKGFSGEVNDALWIEVIGAYVKSLEKGIAEVRAGARIGDIGEAIEEHATAHGFSVVRQFVGHGIGRKLHEAPTVPNFGKARTGDLLKPGMVIAIEPMITAGRGDTRILNDGWTVVTTDGSLAAHFEHTVAVTPSGPEILTRLDG